MTSPAVKKILDALRANHDEAVRLRLELGKAPCSEANSVDAGPRPEDFHPKVVKASLSNPKCLTGAFTWVDTSQGWRFWNDQFIAGALSPEGRAILEKWLAE